MNENVRIEKSDCIISVDTILTNNIKEQYKIYVDNRLNCLLSIHEPILDNFLYINLRMYEISHIDDILNHIEQIIKGCKKVCIPLNKTNELCSYLLKHGYKCNKEYLYGVLFYKKLE